jgi:GT2 family glycosyltransferase/glycosyltransferase involved in cell wall biosynthesis
MGSHSRRVMPGVSPYVEIVVPVAGAPDDVGRCVERVLACTRDPFTLVLVGDARRDARVRALFDALLGRDDPRIAIVRDPGPAGFAETINRGFARSRADVVLLDPSAIVTRGWLDALVRGADSDARIATVTPFSNDDGIGALACARADRATHVCEDTDRIRQALVAAAVPTYPDLPIASGVCMLVRRSALDAVGPFDPAFDARDTVVADFCLRAARSGFRNVLADDAFVAYAGGRTRAEGSETSSLDAERLERAHPHHAAMARDYAVADPLRALRDSAQWRLENVASPHSVLHIVHDLGGGTEAHVRTLIDASPDAWRHYLATAVGDRWQVEVLRGGRATVFSFEREAGESWPAFVGGIAATFGISLVHVHHLSGSRDGGLAALPALGIAYGITIHDLWLACPTVTLTDADDRYCGGITDTDACSRCLAAISPLSDVDIAAWRRAHAELLSTAAFLIAPSRWAADMLARYFPQVRGRVDVIAHATPDDAGESARAASGAPLCAALLPRDDVPTVAVVGAIGRDKGSRRIERLVAVARERAAHSRERAPHSRERVPNSRERAPNSRERAGRVRFVVIGYLDVQHEPWQSDDALLTVHGRYARGDLAALFAHYRVEFVLYPSEGPESFSYTLSEAWRAGMPALVPPIGALAERVATTQAGWIMSDDEWRDDERMLDRLLALVSDAHEAGRRSARAHARAALHPAPLEMAQATLRNYAKALASPHAPHVTSPMSNARIRDALGYAPWVPPEAPRPVAPIVVAPGSVWQRMARRALAMRRTPVGRLIYRMTPEPVIDALKARLHG